MNSQMKIFICLFMSHFSSMDLKAAPVVSLLCTNQTEGLLPATLSPQTSFSMTYKCNIEVESLFHRKSTCECWPLLAKNGAIQ